MNSNATYPNPIPSSSPPLPLVLWTLQPNPALNATRPSSKPTTLTSPHGLAIHAICLNRPSQYVLANAGNQSAGSSSENVHTFMIVQLVGKGNVAVLLRMTRRPEPAGMVGMVGREEERGDREVQKGQMKGRERGMDLIAREED
ncbi:hypothetical protein VTL71DRAFT_3920 [Oculimacula yallundae]|uniref:Uncharacterized protein n=1 Tax=Oculimacula yallundae TaxID=86028 RepID=A0ABR4C4D9_9HELO